MSVRGDSVKYFLKILDFRRYKTSSNRAAWHHRTAQLTHKSRAVTARSVRDVHSNIHAGHGARIAHTGHRVRDGERVAERRQRSGSIGQGKGAADQSSEEENLHSDLAGDNFRSFNFCVAGYVNKKAFDVKEVSMSIDVLNEMLMIEDFSFLISRKRILSKIMKDFVWWSGHKSLNERFEFKSALILVFKISFKDFKNKTNRGS